MHILYSNISDLVRRRAEYIKKKKIKEPEKTSGILT